jgi:hypothetical protein
LYEISVEQRVSAVTLPADPSEAARKARQQTTRLDFLIKIMIFAISALNKPPDLTSLPTNNHEANYMANGTRALSPLIDRDASSLFDVPNSTGSPERRLLLAVLERAILDFVGNDPREVEEAAEWLFGDLPSEDEDDTPPPTQFSFVWICEELDLDPLSIAAKIRLMPKRGARKVAPWYFADYGAYIGRAGACGAAACQ